MHFQHHNLDCRHTSLIISYMAPYLLVDQSQSNIAPHFILVLFYHDAVLLIFELTILNDLFVFKPFVKLIKYLKQKNSAPNSHI